MITLEDYKMGRDITFPLEWTPEREQNAIKFLNALNGFLEAVGLGEADLQVSSGWRPWLKNKQAGGAKKSAHMEGLAIDLKDDKEQSLYHIVAAHPTALKKFGLFLEDRRDTMSPNGNWVHLDMAFRLDRPSRIFKA